MDSIRIDAGVKRIAINDDPTRVIVFDPTDVRFAERFYQLMEELRAKEAEYDAISKELDAHKDEVDENGLPVGIPKGIAFVREICEYMHGKIDELFGAGTAQKVFNGSLNVFQIGQFLDGLTPFIQEVRAEKMLRYMNKKQSGRVMK